VVVISHENDKFPFSFQLDVAKSSAGHFFSLSHTTNLRPMVTGWGWVRGNKTRGVQSSVVFACASVDHVEKRGGTFNYCFKTRSISRVTCCFGIVKEI
jgi:hypothetical protein